MTQLEFSDRPAPSPPGSTRGRTRRSSEGRRARTGAAKRALTPWGFLAPALAFFAVFKFWPIFHGIYDSFLNVRPYLGNQWIGAQNYHRAFHDMVLRTAVWHTVLDAVVTVALSMLVGFLLALLLEGPSRHVKLIRTAVFLPVVTAMVVVAQVWGILMFPSQYGPLNSVLGYVGIGPLGFLTNTHQSLASVMLIQIWKSAPYDMVIFIAGLAGIDRQLYEAANIDGANAWQRLRAVTLPSLRPITTIVLTLGVIRGLRVFTEVYVLTNGGPAGSTQMIVPYTYQTAIQNSDLGYASAISTMLLFVTVVVTCLMLWWRARREAA